MKKIASILLLTFILVLSGSFLGYILTEPASFCMMDEKTETDTELKEKHETTYSVLQLFEIINTPSKAIHMAEKIKTAPCLEKLIPPPDFF